MTTPLAKAYEARNKKLNKVEKTKALKLPMETYAKLQAIAEGGYETLAKEDSAYFLKCFGLFDKGKDFMLRIRIPAGQLTAAQADCIGKVAQTYGKDYIDITTRMQIELRYLDISDIATVLQELDAVGISTFQTGVDNPRNIVTDPLDGIAYDNVIPVMPIIQKMQSLFDKDPEWISALPRKFNTAILGSLSNSCNIYGHDCCFVLAQKEGIFGFNVYLGGRVSMQAKDANLFVTAEEVPLFFASLLRLFRKYGYRDNRNKNRLVYLIRDVGIENLIDAIKEESDMPFATAGEVMTQSQSAVLSTEKILGRDGTFAYKIVVPSGIFTGSDIIEAARLSTVYGSGAIRLSYDQNIYLPSIAPENLEAFKTEHVVEKYSQFDHLYFHNLIACAGRQTCTFGVIDNKPDAIAMADFLYSEVKIEGATVRMNWSGCPKGCGVHGIADIGFEGCKAKDSEGNTIDGVHLLVGGKITRHAKEAKPLHKSLLLTEAKYHVKYLLENYAKHKLAIESYEAFDDRYLSANYSFQAQRFFTIINYVLREKLETDITFTFEEEPKTYKKESFEIFDFGLKLFKLLTGEDRYAGVDDFEPILKQPRKISKTEVSKLNPTVHPKLSEAIYLMTHHDRKIRARVFSEVFTLLKEI